LFSHLDLGRLVTAIATDQKFEPAFTGECTPAEVLGIGTEVDHVPDQSTSYWDRTIRCVYTRRRKVEWDSCGQVQEYGISPDALSHQTLVTDDGQIPECASSVFDVPIEEVTTDHTDFEEMNDTVRGQLEELGYL
jgi:hypothetical protein